jgi:hypothetical protein
LSSVTLLESPGAQVNASPPGAVVSVPRHRDIFPRQKSSGESKVALFPAKAKNKANNKKHTGEKTSQAQRGKQLG